MRHGFKADAQSALAIILGSTQGSSAQTATSPAPTITVPAPTPTPTDAPYLAFNDPLANPWVETPSGQPGLIQPVPGDGSGSVGLVTTGSSYGPNVSSQMTAISTDPIHAHAGISPATGTPVEGQDTWYHVRIRFPSGAFEPTTGQWNWFVEWHDDPITAPGGGGPYSIAMGVYTDYPVVSGGVGQNPHLVLRLAGGQSAAPTYESVELPALVSYDHWYDISFHFVWSTNPAVGLAEWYVDGTQVLSEHFPTLYTRPDGSQGYNEFGVYNYHLAFPLDSTVDFDHIAIGPTRASVGG